MWQPVLGANEREGGRLAAERDARAEAILLMVDHLAKSFVGIQAWTPFHAQGSAEVDPGDRPLTPGQPALMDSRYPRPIDAPVAIVPNAVNRKNAAASRRYPRRHVSEPCESVPYT